MGISHSFDKPIKTNKHIILKKRKKFETFFLSTFVSSLFRQFVGRQTESTLNWKTNEQRKEREGKKPQLKRKVWKERLGFQILLSELTKNAVFSLG